MACCLTAPSNYQIRCCQLNPRNNNRQQYVFLTIDDPVLYVSHFYAWWRHQMETFSALLAICAGNSPVTGEFPAQRLVTRSFDVFFDLRLVKRLSKRARINNREAGYLRRHRAHDDVTVMGTSLQRPGGLINCPSNLMIRSRLTDWRSDRQRFILFSNHRETGQIWGIWCLQRPWKIAQIEWKLCDLEIWRMTPKNIREPSMLLEVCASFHSHPWIQIAVIVRKR